MKTVAVIVGTRPDAIKLAPVIIELRKRPAFRVIVVSTGQHRTMLAQVFSSFGVKPDFDLRVMKPQQSLAQLTENTIGVLDHVLGKIRPDMVLVQGDTTTSFVGSLAAFYRRIPVGHVEAGLRTQDKSRPFPEELNRRMISCIADLNFAPTMASKIALLRENTPPRSIFITGNTGIDALRHTIRKDYSFTEKRLHRILKEYKKIVLVTLHRRESWGLPLSKACIALGELAEGYPRVCFVFPVHLNPIVRQSVFAAVGSSANVHLLDPLPYADFVNLMARSFFLITDSGGIQEEAPSLGKPALVLREVTERPEGVRRGTSKLVGLDPKRIMESARRLFDRPLEYKRMATPNNLYGDGKASLRIAQHLENYFGLSTRKAPEFRPQR